MQMTDQLTASRDELIDISNRGGIDIEQSGWEARSGNMLARGKAAVQHTGPSLSSYGPVSRLRMADARQW